MSEPKQESAGQPGTQREALRQAQHQATESEPANFRDQANAEKIVEIPPVDATEQPIRGLDPK